jgi:hypothetical protein
MLRPISSLLLLLSVGCAPQNAEITGGTYWTFLSYNSSRTLFEANVDLDAADDHYAVDCRPLGQDEDPLPGALDICGSDTWPPRHEGWLRRDAFEVISEPLDPWRGEAVITSEGDLLLTFHHRPPGSEDFRFAIVINPEFEPLRCVQTEGGGVEYEVVDGLDWVEQWSADEDGSLYFLNSGAYQFNPSNTEDLWVLPQEWRAGYATARYAAEDFSMRRVRYGLPSAYIAFEVDDAVEPTAADLFYTAMMPGSDPTESGAFQAQIDRVLEVADDIEAEMAMVEVTFRPMVHTNEWRIPDGHAGGLDGWVELHYNWIRFDSGSDLEVGGEASGDFGLVFDAQESQSRVFITGSFQIDRIKRDRWVTADVEAAKLEEYGTTLCGE